MDPTEVRIKLRDKVKHLDQDDIEIYNDFLDICAELECYPPKGE